MKVLLIEDNSEIVDIVTITLQLRWAEVTLISTFLGNEGVAWPGQSNQTLSCSTSACLT